MDDTKTTAEIQGIAAGQIANQAKLCAANLDAVRDKIESINGDMHDIAGALEGLRATVETLNVEVAKLQERWNTWRTLEKLAGVLLPLASLVAALVAWLK